MSSKRKSRNLFRTVIIAPFIFVMLIGFLIFDIFLSLSHRIVFAICKLKRVNRTSHFKVDQMKIAQLEKMQRFFAVVFLYMRGLMSYAGKIVSECEDHWCTPRPMKGAQHMAVDKSKMGVKELKAYQQSVKQKPKKSRKK